MSLTTPAATNPDAHPGAFATTGCEQLPWDSEFFGLKVGRLYGNRLTPERAAATLEWCREKGVGCLYFLADAADPQTAQAAEAAGFRFVDVRCTYEFELSPRRPGALSTAVRPFEPGDLPALERIASANHTDSRFYFDGGFRRERCDALFATWIRRSCSGWADAVFVAGFAGCPAGYITCHLRGQQNGSIGLIALDHQFRGHGFGQQLVSAALDYFRQRGVRRVEVVTQGRNVRSQQMYQRSGFAIRDFELWYHLWPAHR